MQGHMHVRMLASAKVNLTLEVTGRRDDGYHELRSVVRTLDTGDVLDIRNEARTDGPDLFSSSNPGWIPERSLVPKAVEAFRGLTGIQTRVSITLFKATPLSSGLGGESSCAAATLAGLNRLMGAGLTHAELAGMASMLGSDTTFFIYGGTGFMGGRGERVVPLKDAPTNHFVIVLPRMEVPDRKTAAAYGRITPEHYTDGSLTESLVKKIEAGDAVVESDLANAFDRIAHDSYPGIGRYMDAVSRLSGSTPHLSGAGPTIFSMVEGKRDAERMVSELDRQGITALRAASRPREM